MEFHVGGETGSAAGADTAPKFVAVRACVNSWAAGPGADYGLKGFAQRGSVARTGSDRVPRNATRAARS